MDICGHCGVIARSTDDACSVCDAAISVRTTAPASGEVYWVRVVARFTCRVCGLEAPMNHLDGDGEVDCLRCGAAQAFEVAKWKAALAEVQGVGDLAGKAGATRIASTEGRLEENPYADLGVSRVVARVETYGMTVDASPGAPTCPRCHLALEIEPDPSSTTTRCTSCGDTASYAIPPRSREVASKANVRSVIAAEERTDRDAVRTEADAKTAAVAITCPRCAASLTPAGDTTTVTCAYCNTVSRIPQKLWYRLTGAGDPMPWWIAFAGPSPRRAALTRRRLAAADFPAAPRKMTPELESYFARGFEAPSEMIWFAVGFPFILFTILGDVMKQPSQQESTESNVSMGKIFCVGTLGLIAFLAAIGAIKRYFLLVVIGYVAVTLLIGFLLARSETEKQKKLLAARRRVFEEGRAIDVTIDTVNPLDIGGVRARAKVAGREISIDVPEALASRVEVGGTMELLVDGDSEDVYSTALLAEAMRPRA